MQSKLIRDEQHGRGWVLWVGESTATQPVIAVPAPVPEVSGPDGRPLTPKAFEELARGVMGQHFGVALTSGKVPGVHKAWDMISLDGQYAGDAKYYTLVKGHRLPPAKFSADKTAARIAALTAGVNDGKEEETPSSVPKQLKAILAQLES